MKKTLIAVAALSAMAASAMAANVTLYGKLDQGIQVRRQSLLEMSQRPRSRAPLELVPALVGV